MCKIFLGQSASVAQYLMIVFSERRRRAHQPFALPSQWRERWRGIKSAASPWMFQLLEESPLTQLGIISHQGRRYDRRGRNSDTSQTLHDRFKVLRGKPVPQPMVDLVSPLSTSSNS